MQQHYSKYFALRHLPVPAVGVKTQHFLEHGHIKLKGITKCSSMVANILPADPSLTLGMGSIGRISTFSEHGHVAYQRTSDSLNEELPIKMPREKFKRK